MMARLRFAMRAIYAGRDYARLMARFDGFLRP